MSHQGYPGWFPECLLCGMGNLDAFVCVIPLQDEQHGLVEVPADAPPGAFDEAGHSWKRCALCSVVALADPFSWGSVGYCTDCWNAAVRAGRYPPLPPMRT